VNESVDIASVVVNEQIDREIERIEASVTLLCQPGALECGSTEELEQVFHSILRIGAMMRISMTARLN